MPMFAPTNTPPRLSLLLPLGLLFGSWLRFSPCTEVKGYNRSSTSSHSNARVFDIAAHDCTDDTGLMSNGGTGLIQLLDYLVDVT